MEYESAAHNPVEIPVATSNDSVSDAYVHEQTEKQEYFYDVSSGKMLVGQKELETYLEQEEADTSTIFNLADLLRNEEIEVPDFVYKRKPKRTKEQLLKYGRWLSEVVGKPDNRYERTLNHTIITRASRLDLGPSPWEITHHPAFKTLARFYTELGLS